MPVTEQQARAIAYIAVAARPHGAPKWDESGVIANILKVRDRSLSSVAIAVMQAAEDRGAVTPGVIATNGPHWRDPGSAPPPSHAPYERTGTCGTCGKSEATCRRMWSDDHPFESVAELANRPKADHESATDYARQAIGDAKATGITPPPEREHKTHPEVDALRGEVAAAEVTG